MSKNNDGECSAIFGTWCMAGTKVGGQGNSDTAEAECKRWFGGDNRVALPNLLDVGSSSTGDRTLILQSLDLFVALCA